MAGSNRMTKRFIIALLAGCISLLVSGAAWSQSQSSTNDSSGQRIEALSIKGKVKSVSLETKTILIKPKKGATLNISFNEQTTLIAFDSFDDIKEKQSVTVWYTVEGENNIAVKIEKAPETGC